MNLLLSCFHYKFLDIREGYASKGASQILLPEVCNITDSFEVGYSLDRRTAFQRFVYDSYFRYAKQIFIKNFRIVGCEDQLGVQGIVTSVFKKPYKLCRDRRVQ